MKTFCLGTMNKKCETCQHEKNWQILNQMPDALRLSMQKKMINVNITACCLSKMSAYVEATNEH